MDYLTKCFTEVKLNCFFYMEFYAAVFGFFFIELITYLIAHYVATESKPYIYNDICVRFVDWGYSKSILLNNSFYPCWIVWKQIGLLLI